MAESTRSRAHHYRFETRWLVPGAVAEVADVLFDPEDLVRWWPAVYLRVRQVAPAGEDGVGARFDLHTTGWLPYTLRWHMHVTRHTPSSSVFTATGDLAGRGEFRLSQRGPLVEVLFDWRVRANKPLLRWFSPALRPVFAANHRWAMAQGERSLRVELLRRRATTAAEAAEVPPPPRRTAAGPLPVVGTLAVLGGGALVLTRALRRH
ncbi:hypothetical protein LX15_005815 [Streptoalloteichus tenebrarius]|uniref:Polyketide cyclase n=1 Tax=Streptoalloteichus tenebrarius (strain ATCC 17920 / DSM 40477 / JCM 4838 / CBS 697.72 / NBRC 16177 / NCIMB 11028 / NRRL B-12390 / A12253. 1 / ISP 5477) TaxID=1933 RepID=A0ABT1I2R7_STRSD|nr:hypothetical protein [Streptoalloteichus tenebrarius]MCP2262083.1 hypothetical protein [Streptoalloteichus tenebrarius]BFF02237.1 hypothetical protein GCM10020241_39120 [Streptoalloteichus tenebrarius]